MTYEAANERESEQTRRRIVNLRNFAKRFIDNEQFLLLSRTSETPLGATSKPLKHSLQVLRRGVG